MEKVGTVLEGEDGFYVVKQTVNGQAVVLESLEKFVAGVTLMQHDGVTMSVSEFLAIKSDEYMRNNKVIRFER